MAMSEFGKAFASARKAGDKTFMFKGKKYTTETKEEKDARTAKAAPKAAPKKDMPPAERAGTTKSQAAEKPRAVAAKPERKPIRMEGLERAKEGISGMMASRQRRLDMEEADRKSRGDKYGMGMKKGGMVKKGRDGMASKGKTKGRMC